MKKYIDYTDEEFLNAIAKASEEEKLIVFLGAGVSKLFGYPLWKEAAVHLIEYCQQQLKCNLTNEVKNLLLNEIHEPKKLMTIGYTMLHDVDESDKLYNTFIAKEFGKRNWSAEQAEKLSKVKESISSISNIIFSTNIDELFDDCCNADNLFYEEKHIFGLRIKQATNQVWHIHGSIKDPSSIIFTVPEYIKRYSNDDFRKNFIDLVNNGYLFLFVGYGLSELELLEILLRGNAKQGDKGYSLGAYRNYQEPVYRADVGYYDCYGIHLVKYGIVENNYDRLINVLEYIAEIVNPKKTHNIPAYRTLTRIIADKPTNELRLKFFENIKRLNDQDAITLISNMDPKTYGPDWIYEMIHFSNTKKYFSVESNLISKEGKKSYNIEAIRVLLNMYSNDKPLILIDDLRKIVKEVVEKDDQGINQELSAGVMKFSLSDTELINDDKVMSYICQCAQESSNHYKFAIMLSDNVNNIKNAKEELRILLYKTAYLFFDCGSDDFTPGYLERKDVVAALSGGCNKELFDYSIDILKKKYSDNSAFSDSRNLDCFEVIQNKENSDTEYYHPGPYGMIRWMLYELSHITDEKVIMSIYDMLREDDENLFCTRLAIYLCNIKFEHIGLQKLLTNSFVYDRVHYAEMYSLVRNKINEFDSNDIFLIREFINKINFKENHTLFETNAKLQLCRLSDKFKDVYDVLYSALDQEHREALSEYPEPIELSKSMWTTTIQEPPSNNSLEKLSFDEYLDFIERHKEDYDLINSEVDQRKNEDYERLNLKRVLVDPNIDLNRFHYLFVKMLITVYFKDGEDDCDDCYEVLKHIDKLKQHRKEVICSFAKTMRFYGYHQYAGVREKWKEIDDFFVSELELYADYYLTDNGGDRFWNSKPSMYLLSAAIVMADKVNWERLKALMKKQLEKNNKNYLIRVSLAYNAKQIYDLDKEYLFEKVPFIFDTEDKIEIEGVYTGFLYNSVHYQFYDSDWIELLRDQGILSDIFKRQYKDNFIECYGEGLFSKVMFDELPVDIVPVIIEADGLTAFSMFLYELINKDNEKYDEHLDSLLLILKTLEPLLKAKQDGYAGQFLQLGHKFSKLKEECFIIIEKLCSFGFDSINIERIREAFTGYSNVDKIQLVKWVTFKMKCHEYESESFIKLLFEDIDWTGKNEDFKEVIQNLKKNNDADLVTKICDKYSAKYETDEKGSK